MGYCSRTTASSYAVEEPGHIKYSSSSDIVRRVAKVFKLESLRQLEAPPHSWILNKAVSVHEQNSQAEIRTIPTKAPRNARLAIQS